MCAWPVPHWVRVASGSINALALLNCLDYELNKPPRQKKALRQRSKEKPVPKVGVAGGLGNCPPQVQRTHRWLVGLRGRRGGTDSRCYWKDQQRTIRRTKKTYNWRYQGEKNVLRKRTERME